MNEGVHYTTYHPKWYRPNVSVWWWLKSWAYTMFVLRELTSIFVAFYVVVLLFELRALLRGPEAYTHFLARMQTPVFLALNFVALLFVLLHAITWFNLAPKAMVVRLGGKRVSDRAIAGLNYLAWVVVSGVVAWIWLRGSS